MKHSNNYKDTERGKLCTCIYFWYRYLPASVPGYFHVLSPKNP